MEPTILLVLFFLPSFCSFSHSSLLLILLIPLSAPFLILSHFLPPFSIMLCPHYISHPANLFSFLL
jgi:hypothetical protein